MTELHEAVKAGNVDRVREILQSINDRAHLYKTPLHLVYDCHGSADSRRLLTQMLLDCGADVNARDIYCKTPLFYAINENEIEGVRLLLENGADPFFRDDCNRTALHITNNNRKPEIIKMLLDRGVDVNAVDGSGRTPLAEAILCADYNGARILMDAGAKVKNIFQLLVHETSLLRENEEDRTELLEFLKQYGAEIDPDGRFSIRALYFAGLETRFSEDVKKCLHHIHNLEGSQGKGKGMTELHKAAENKDDDQVRALLETGANVNAKNVIGETPLHMILDSKDPIYGIDRLLVEAGADLCARNCFGDTPLRFAAREGDSKIVDLMLAKISGIQESSLDNRPIQIIGYVIHVIQRVSEQYNSYPLAYAIALGYEDVVDRLIDLGHHIEATKDLNCRPPLYFAIQWGWCRIVKMLHEAGCKIDEHNLYHVPYFNSEQCSDDLLELMCLLWELDLFHILKIPLIEIFESIKNDLPTNFLIELLIFYYKFGLDSNKLSKDFISLTGYFYPNERISRKFALCDDQIEELKKDLVCGSLCKFDLLAMKLDSLMEFLNDENNFKACKKLFSSFGENMGLQTYECAMKVRIDLAMEEKILLDSAKDFLNKALEDVLNFLKLNSLPDEITSNILSYFNMREIRKMSVEH